MTNDNPDASRTAYYEQIARQRMTPLWESLHSLVPKAPRPKTLPAIWKYAQVRDLVMRAGCLISAEEAVRRVLVLENPGLPGKSSMTPNLYAGLRLIVHAVPARRLQGARLSQHRRNDLLRRRRQGHGQDRRR
jgi:gentisate 1,2-dioxygenase